MATSTSSSTMTPPAIATLSRRRRIHAIWPRERPSIALPPTLASTASRTASAAVGETSIGAVIELLSRTLPASPPHPPTPTPHPPRIPHHRPPHPTNHPA